MSGIVAGLVVAFLLLRGWRGMFPWERRHRQTRRETPPAVVVLDE